MEEFIKIQDKDLFLLHTDLLGVPEAQLWIGTTPDSPTDNDDERVLRDRARAELEKMQAGWRISGIEAVNLSQSTRFPNWFEVNTKNWAPGVYRFNIHSRPYIKAPHGTELRPIRDGQYSWPYFSDEYLRNLSDAQKQFLHLGSNKAGFCMRIEITNDRDIKPMGNGVEWIPQWPQIKKEIEEHYKEKMQQVKKVE